MIKIHGQNGVEEFQLNYKNNKKGVDKFNTFCYNITMVSGVDAEDANTQPAIF